MPCTKGTCKSRGLLERDKSEGGTTRLPDYRGKVATVSFDYLAAGAADGLVDGIEIVEHKVAVVLLQIEERKFAAERAPPSDCSFVIPPTRMARRSFAVAAFLSAVTIPAFSAGSSMPSAVTMAKHRDARSREDHIAMERDGRIQVERRHISSAGGRSTLDLSQDCLLLLELHLDRARRRLPSRRLR